MAPAARDDLPGPPPIDPGEPPPGDYAPTDEPELDSLSPSSLNPVHRLLGLLVLKPALEKLVPDTLLVTEGNRDDVLLTEVVAHIRRYPEVTTAALLGFWFGTPEGDFLNALAGRETIEDDAGLEALGKALVEKLNRHPALDAARQRVEALKRKPYGELTAEEKQQLLSLTGGSESCQTMLSRDGFDYYRVRLRGSDRTIRCGKRSLAALTWSPHTATRPVNYLSLPLPRPPHSPGRAQAPLMLSSRGS